MYVRPKLTFVSFLCFLFCTFPLGHQQGRGCGRNVWFGKSMLRVTWCGFEGCEGVDVIFGKGGVRYKHCLWYNGV